MQVLASGKKDFVTSQNLIFGVNLKPSNGSSSLEVLNCKIDSNLILPRRPATVYVKKKKMLKKENV
jgi:hypothetical protein